MAGFIRRFTNFPGIETITLIEGVVIVDTPPAGSITGVSTGVVGLVAEFPDMTYGTAVDNVGVVTTLAKPVEVFSSKDMLDKVGGFDSTIGQHGNAGGNGFISLRNKKFSRLVCVPVNLASGGGGRAWRDLPTNLSATQAIPVVALSGGIASAGREFRNGNNRVHIGAAAQFTTQGHYKNGTDGAGTSAGAAATQTFNSATGAFTTAKNGSPVQKGDILVVGVISGAGALGANALTLRVAADATIATQLTVQKMDGTNFDWTTGTNFPYRVHPAQDADTAGTKGGQFALADVGGYKLPARPLDATIAAATLLTPTIVPAAGTATSWDSLSGLTLRSHHSAGFVYDANVQGVNAANHASIDALYVTAVDSLLADQAPARDVKILCTSRSSTNIVSKLKSHVLTASTFGVGRTAVVSPPLTTVSQATVVGDPAPGVGANRDERVDYAWPGLQTFVPEAVGLTLGTADGSTTQDGLIDTPADLWLAALMSNLAPERNPGEATPVTKEVMSTVAGFQRSAPTLGVQEYINLRANGVAAPRNDRKAGFIFQSGVTTSLVNGQKNINRRRFADFIQDSVADALNPFAKQPLTQNLKDTMVTEVDEFCLGMLSPDNPPAQRIDSYQIDDKSGNTAQLSENGIFVIIGRVRMTPTADFIVFQSEVGNGVVITKINT